MFNLTRFNLAGFNFNGLDRLPITIREKVIKVLPKILKPSFVLIPFKVQKLLLLKMLTSIFHQAITEGDFEFLQNKWLKISITDLGIDWWLSFDGNQLMMMPHTSNIVEDVCFSATGDDLLLIAGRKQDPDTLFFQRRLKIEGDTELGLEVKNLIDAIELDQLPTSLHKAVDGCAKLVQQTHDDIAQSKLRELL
ncbi:MAG: SCP2 sterol-binding domain-containing protein [Colwellia sp.]|nr:SCP2 sterol-binding domain-containing protein [Colwellia sp.]